jgi:hypothetical protein
VTITRDGGVLIHPGPYKHYVNGEFVRVDHPLSELEHELLGRAVTAAGISPLRICWVRLYEGRAVIQTDDAVELVEVDL